MKKSVFLNKKEKTFAFLLSPFTFFYYLWGHNGLFFVYCLSTFSQSAIISRGIPRVRKPCMGKYRTGKLALLFGRVYSVGLTILRRIADYFVQNRRFFLQESQIFCTFAANF